MQKLWRLHGRCGIALHSSVYTYVKLRQVSRSSMSKYKNFYAKKIFYAWSERLHFFVPTSCFSLRSDLWDIVEFLFISFTFFDFLIYVIYYLVNHRLLWGYSLVMSRMKWAFLDTVSISKGFGDQIASFSSPKIFPNYLVIVQRFPLNSLNVFKKIQKKTN